ncbi:MAG: cytochrome c biosis protein transrane region [Acidimicrobiales bacterium]|nr:cytochrome c biosis protein transrane region [Acidimicrobiales bacterium]
MIDAPLTLAFTAGMVAAVNPCGFAMLPAYLSYFLGIERTGDDAPPAVGVVRALVVGGVVSAGFAVLFGVAGALISWTSLSVTRASPWITVVIGMVLVAAGAAFILGWEPRLAVPHLGRGGHDRGLWSMFGFGLSYAVASLSCTLGPFSVVVTQTFSRSSVIAGIATFMAYALGMAVLLIALTVALATARQGLLRGLRRSLPYVQRAAGAIMVLMGGYLAWYGIVEIRTTSRRGSVPQGSAPVDAVSSLSSDITGWVTRVGAVRIGLVLALLVVAVVLVALLRSPASTDASDPPEPDRSLR